MKVAVLSGGSPLERGVSLRSAARVAAALAQLGHAVLPIEAGPDLVRRLSDEQPELAFVAMRGSGGDGTAQELLEILDIPYTGSDAGSCERCMDRARAKHELRAAGVATPDWFALSETAFREFGAADAVGELERRIGFPLTIKPSRGGAALGVSRVASWFEVPAALISAFDYDDRVLLERSVSGAELELPLLAGGLLAGSEAAPAEAESVAVAAYKALGCAGVAAVRLVLGKDGPQALEVDPIPALDESSLLPASAAAAGIGFERLVERILELALERSAS